MTEQMDILQGYVNDMLAVEHEMHQAFRRQKHSDTPSSHPESARLIARIEDTIDAHIAELKRALESLGGSESMLKSAVGKALGAAAGIYNQVRSDRVSTMVRDDLTALNFAVACYQMLHTTALALHDQPLADTALRHIEDFHAPDHGSQRGVAGRRPQRPRARAEGHRRRLGRRRGPEEHSRGLDAGRERPLNPQLGISLPGGDWGVLDTRQMRGVQYDP